MAHCLRSSALVLCLAESTCVELYSAWSCKSTHKFTLNNTPNTFCITLHSLCFICILTRCRSIWDANTGACLHVMNLSHHVLSLDFHPTEHMLVIACGKNLLLWDYEVCMSQLTVIGLLCRSHLHFRDDTAGYLSFHPMIQCVVLLSKAWLAARVSLRRARLPHTASSAQRSLCLRFMRAAVPVLFARSKT